MVKLERHQLHWHSLQWILFGFAYTRGKDKGYCKGWGSGWGCSWGDTGWGKYSSGSSSVTGKGPGPTWTKGRFTSGYKIQVMDLPRYPQLDASMIRQRLRDELGRMGLLVFGTGNYGGRQCHLHGRFRNGFQPECGIHLLLSEILCI